MTNRMVLQMGPWPKGVNSIQAESRLEDDELAYAINAEMDERGFIYSRRPIQVITDYGDPVTSSELLGVIPIKVTDENNNEIVEDAGVYIINGVVHAVYALGDSVQTLLIYDAATAGDVYEHFRHIFAYDNRYYLLSSDPACASYYADIIADLDSLVWTPITTGPQNGSLVAESYALFLDRLYVTDGNMVYYSTAYDLLDWVLPPDGGGGFVIVGTRTGEEIRALHVQSSSLYILTSDGVWQFSFGSSPNEDGTLTQLNQKNILMALYYNDRLFVVTPEGLHIFINNTLYKQPIKTDLNFSKVTGMFGLDNNIILCHSDNIVGYALCIDTATGSITQWNFNLFLGIDEILTTNKYQTRSFVFQTPSLGEDTYVLVRCRKTEMIAVVPFYYERINPNEFYDSYYDTQELKIKYVPYSIHLKTKEFDFGANFRYKRIFYGTADLNATGQQDGRLFVTDVSRRTGSYPLRVVSPLKFRYLRIKVREVSVEIEYRPTTYADSSTLRWFTKEQRVDTHFTLSSANLVYEVNDLQRGALV